MLRGKDLEQLLAGEGDLPATAESTEPVAESTGAPSKSAPAVDQAQVVLLCNGAVSNLQLGRSSAGGPRIGDGCSMAYRLAEHEPLSEAVLGGPSLPWALEVTARRMQVGDIMQVVASGEYALADDEEVKAPGVANEPEKRWRFELATASGQAHDKFKLSVDERIALASELKERGSAMLRKGRLLRAVDYYQRGSSLMDVLEAEDLGLPGNKNPKAVASNTRIRECQQPILLNWALVLMKRNLWKEAEDKCTEVLLDIDKGCVKALFRRGQCRVQLSSLEEARKDLLAARDLDSSVAGDVEKELAKLQRQQKVLDREDRSWAKKALGKGLDDARSTLGHFLPPGQSGSDSSTAAESGALVLQDDDNEGIDCRVTDSSKTRVNPTSATEALAADAHPLMAALKAQERTADAGGVDDLTYCRQRELIYNQFLSPKGALDD
ncbi:unnamed protein product [Polarella glacialis]|uniref:Peptidylprolyl isomerase n=1 Tax=Polarella glacialis TaxID=89957 RepID=A0A813F847_POLGL|nr:unnamed protein product [Polarella glacialis]CAE8725148.1 unnamed protein product [Polarella glacialis]